MNPDQIKYEKRVESLNTIFLKKDNFELKYGLYNTVYGQMKFSISIRENEEPLFYRDKKLISKEFPEFSHLTKWCGFNYNGGDSNYISDGIFYARHLAGFGDDFLDYYGALEPISESLLDFKTLTFIEKDEDLPNLRLENGEDEEAFKARIGKWLEDRRKVFMEEMKKDLIEVGVIDP